MIFINKKILFAFLVILACKPGLKKQEVELSPYNKLLFLDSSHASMQIIQDSMDGFFDEITPTDICLQLKRAFDPSLRKKDLLPDYQFALKKAVMPFSSREKRILESLTKEIFVESQELHSNFLPPELKLAKITSDLYGSNVFFTREQTIFIPKSAVLSLPRWILKEILVHEIAHIFTRYNPELKHSLYSIIGFQPLSDSLVIPPQLQKRRLINPDGVSSNYVIKLSNNISAVPFIVSSPFPPIPDRISYFQHVSFQLFPVMRNDSLDIAHVEANEMGLSDIDLAATPEFFKQISRNTDYYIHPDEIIAEQIKFLISSIPNPSYLNKFDAQGQRLLAKIKAMILKHDAALE